MSSDRRKKRYTIPFFIPHKGCPCKCIFCDQDKISGQEETKVPDIPAVVEKYLSTIRERDAWIEVGFFGGTFTALPVDLQEHLLVSVKGFLDSGRIKGIRVSTRPDNIDEGKTSFLGNMGVIRVELGVQSMSDRVLKACQRGHTAHDSEVASKIVKKAGLGLTHQLMLGLPESGREEEYHSAVYARKAGADEVRIYPAVVIKGTEMERLFREGSYCPLPEDEAVMRAAHLILFFEASGMKVIRCGLHPSEDLLSGAELVAGPFHESFRAKAESLLYGYALRYTFKEMPDIHELCFNPSDEPYLYGYMGQNAAVLKSLVSDKGVTLRKDPSLARGSMNIVGRNGTRCLDREHLASAVLPEGLMKGLR
ncbi:MAG: radical SAM protein [Candidatus Omnitrophica bacterium]|nr:radical SAM protein [Candidatus Omnitrophota bacterium]MDD5487533.1 radical SAM protein [Candidatus Omnitrophota bacterium]